MKVQSHPWWSTSPSKALPPKILQPSQTAVLGEDQVFKYEPMGDISPLVHNCSLSTLVIDHRMEHVMILLP